MSVPDPRLFSYVVAYDTGFAPHVYDGLCTLATCKPKIRRSARHGDWIVGTSSRRYSSEPNRMIFLMQVTEEPMSFEEYDRGFPERRPSSANPLGDNIYFFDPESGKLVQRENARHGATHRERDLSGQAVLVSRRFAYFGRAMPRFPDGIDLVKKGPGHRSNFDPATLQRFFDWSSEIVGPEGWNRCFGDPNG